jgi:hypothetical protein
LNEPRLVASYNEQNVVFYDNYYYVVPQSLGTLNIDKLHHRWRNGIQRFTTESSAVYSIIHKERIVADETKKLIPVVIMIGADKGGVGKTTVCRVLLDWLDEKLPPGSKTRVFDTQWPNGDLKNFRLGVDVVNITNIEDQMIIFDNVEDMQATIVDVSAGHLFPSLETMDRAGLLRDVAKGDIRMIVMHVIGPTISSLGEVGEVMSRIGGGAVRHVLVKNHYNDTRYRVANDPRYVEVLRAAAANTINVPQLVATAIEEIQQQSVGFAQFVKGFDLLNQPVARKNSRMLVGYTAKWLSDVWSEFERVGIGNAFLV